MTWAAASADPASLIQFGAIGIILALFLVGYAWTKPSVDHIIQDKLKAETQRDELIRIYQTQIIPLLVEVKDKMLPALAGNQKAIVEMGESLAKLKVVIDAMDRHLTRDGRK